MRYAANIIAMLVIVPLLFSCAATYPDSVGSEGGLSSSGQSDVKVSIAVVEGGKLSTSSVLHVIIENISDKPQNHFDEWNSWGYFNLTLQWTDAQGHSGTVAKVVGGPLMWMLNSPTTTVLQPGESLVREISFDPKLWEGLPAVTAATNLTLKITYHSTDWPMDSSIMSRHPPGWIGSVTSKEQMVTLVPANETAK